MKKHKVDSLINKLDQLMRDAYQASRNKKTEQEQQYYIGQSEAYQNACNLLQAEQAAK